MLDMIELALQVTDPVTAAMLIALWVKMTVGQERLHEDVDGVRERVERVESALIE